MVWNDTRAFQFSQLGNHLIAKFGMRLHCKCLAAINDSDVFAKGVPGNLFGSHGQGYNLILMLCVRHNVIIPPSIRLATDRPSSIKFRNFATESLCNNLMAEANADPRHISGLGVVNRSLERWDKTMFFIRTMPRSRKQPSIANVHRSRKIHINHFEGFKRKPFAC